MNKLLLEVMQKIKDAGFNVYVVGGYVRDYLLKNNSLDFDLSTNATPQDLINIWGNNIISNNYGSVVLKYKKDKFQITTFRKDIKYQNNRFPKIEYVDTIDADVLRRDFTINSLYMDIDGNIIDKLGGMDDIKNKIVKMVGNPYDKINEDALRILRAIRFATIYNFKIDKELYNAIKELAFLVKRLSYQRKKEELDKIFTSKNLKYGIELLKEFKLDKYLEINLDKIFILPDLLVMWSQVDKKHLYPHKRHFKEQIRKVNELLKKDILDPINLYHYGLFISLTAGIIKGIKIKDINEKYSSLPILVKKDIKVNANDICNILCIKPSNKIGVILGDIEAKILNGNLVNDYNEISNYILYKYKKF